MVTVTVAQVLTAVRDEHPRFARSTTGDGPVVRSIDRFQRSLMPMIADLKRDAVSVTTQITMPLATHSDGFTIPEHILVHGGVVVFENAQRDDEPITDLPYRYETSRWDFSWPVYVQDNTLFPGGRASDWTGVARIDVRTFPSTTAVAGKSDTFALPKDGLAVLVAHAAAFMEQRLAAAEKRKADPHFENAKAKETILYINQVTGRKRARATVGRVSW